MITLRGTSFAHDTIELTQRDFGLVEDSEERLDEELPSYAAFVRRRFQGPAAGLRLVLLEDQAPCLT